MASRVRATTSNGSDGAFVTTMATRLPSGSCAAPAGLRLPMKTVKK